MATLQSRLYEAGKGDVFEAYNAGKISRGAAESALTGGGSGAAPSTSAPDYISIAKQMQQMQQEASKPAIESMRATIPTTEAAFAERGRQLTAEKEPLKERYQALIADLGRRETREIEETGGRLSREYGKRGIPLSSGAYEQALEQAYRPTREFYAGQIKETGLSQEEALRDLSNLIANLPIEKQQSLDEINKAIAQIQSGGASDAITNALSLYQSQQQANQAAASLALQQRAQAEAERATKASEAFTTRQFEEYNLPQLAYELAKPYYKPTAGSGETIDWESELGDIFGQGIPQYKSSTGGGYSGYGPSGTGYYYG